MTEATGPDLREAIARVIDPGSFKSWQSLHDYCVLTGDGPQEARDIADRTHLATINNALSKAEEILALLTPAHPDPEWPEREAWLAELEAAAKKATPGAWTHFLNLPKTQWIVRSAKRSWVTSLDWWRNPANGNYPTKDQSEANAAYIALANPEAVLRLIAIARAAGGKQ